MEHYSLEPPTSAFHRRLLACLDECGEQVPDLARDHRRRIQLVSCCPADPC